MSRSRTSTLPLFFAIGAAILVGLFTAPRASALERNFAGSAQFDESIVPSALGTTDGHSPLRTFDGFTTEIAVKLAVDFSSKLSANVKVCYGCHGFETDMAYFDYRFSDEIGVRMGRFSPSFGAFNIRHDPANHRLSDKPLPYDMGRMLRMRDWNMGVLPAPFPDNGVELDGSHWFGADKAQVDYAAYAVSGFKAANQAYDIDFTQSRSGSAYYVDNNGRPTIGGRVAFTFKLDSVSDLTLGGSGQYGTYDPDNKLSYAIVGSDLTLRHKRTNLRFEWLARRQTFDTSNPSELQYAVTGSHGNVFVRHGFYAELEQPITETVDLVGRFDGLVHEGNVLAHTAQEPGIENGSTVLRWTFGAAWAVERGLRLKASAELWRFSDADFQTGQHVEPSFHVAAVGSF